MLNEAPTSQTREIVVEEVFPHAAATIWACLTSGALMTRWMMQPLAFEPVEGCHFTFKTTPAGAWDGVIHCDVLEVRPNERFAYRWQAGHEGNVGYGSKLDTVVTWTLFEDAGGTRLRLVHSGFSLPTNGTTFQTLGEGWKTVISRLRAATDDRAGSGAAPPTSRDGRSA